MSQEYNAFSGLLTGGVFCGRKSGGRTGSSNTGSKETQLPCGNHQRKSGRDRPIPPACQARIHQASAFPVWIGPREPGTATEAAAGYTQIGKQAVQEE